MKQLQAYHNKPSIKKQYLKRITCHRLADELIHGTYWANGKGCAIGCILHSSCHNKFETELGLPEWLAHLVDFLFERLPNGQAKIFPETVLKSIKVGTNLDLVYHKFCLFLLKEVCKETDNPIVKPSIDKIIELHTKILTYKKVSDEEWSAARSAARSAELAVESAARSAARSAAWSAAESAAWSVESAARSAAWSAELAAWSAARSAAWSAAVIKISEKLIELLKDNK